MNSERRNLKRALILVKTVMVVVIGVKRLGVLGKNSRFQHIKSPRSLENKKGDDFETIDFGQLN